MTDTQIPNGHTCGQCVYFRQCSAHFGRVSADRDCEHSPAAFRLAPVPAAPPAPRRPSYGFGTLRPIRTPKLRVSCPECGAEPGERCPGIHARRSRIREAVASFQLNLFALEGA